MRGLLEADGETFVADVHSNQRIWLEDPKPAAPQIATGQRQSAKPKAFSPGEEVRDWAAGQPAQDGIAFKRRDGINGALLVSDGLAAGGKFAGDQIRARQRAR